jgi:hypothetical protein
MDRRHKEDSFPDPEPIMCSFVIWASGSIIPITLPFGNRVEEQALVLSASISAVYFSLRVLMLCLTLRMDRLPEESSRPNHHCGSQEYRG